MSGGAWDYAYLQVDDIVDRLETSKDPLRRALGEALRPFIAALRDIEWVDSGDYSRGREHDAIRAALGEGAEERAVADTLAEALTRAEALTAQLRELRG